MAISGKINPLGRPFDLTGEKATKAKTNQPGHGLIVGDAIRFDGTNYVKAQANSEYNSQVIGVVTKVIDANTFEYATGGPVKLTGPFTPGKQYYLSETTPGLLTTTKPTGVGNYNKPLFIATSATDGVWINHRSLEAGQIQYKTVTEIHDLVSGYDVTPDYLPVGNIVVYRNGLLETDWEYSGGDIVFDDILEQEKITLIYSYQL